MISNFNLQPNLGYLKFTTPPTNRSVIFRSCYHTNNDTSQPLIEENYAHLINFLNYDVSELNDLIHTTLLSILEDSSDIDTLAYINSIGNKLIEWHPFFAYHLLYTVCDLLISYSLEFIPYDYESRLLSDFTDKMIRTICTKLTDLLNITNTELTADFLELYQFNDIRIHYRQRFDFPLGVLEDFREFIADNIPNVIFSSNPNTWTDFFKIAHNRYGDFIKQSSYDIANIIIPTTYISSEPDYQYPIDSFPHYIVTQLESFREIEYCIAFCNKCGKFYIKNFPHSKHPCSSDEYFSLMNSRNKTIYQRMYQRANKMANSDKTNITASTINYLRDSGFMKFHTDTFRYAIRHHISLETYKKYTEEENYDINTYHVLPPLPKYTSE